MDKIPTQREIAKKIRPPKDNCPACGRPLEKALGTATNENHIRKGISDTLLKMRQVRFYHLDGGGSRVLRPQGKKCPVCNKPFEGIGDR